MPAPGAMPGLWFEQGGDHERRRERQAIPRMRRTRWPRRQRQCLACLRPLTNGAIVCCPQYDDL
jgi:hypothetical protein